jgi:hypothetical protein
MRALLIEAHAVSAAIVLSRREIFHKAPRPFSSRVPNWKFMFRQRLENMMLFGAKRTAPFCNGLETFRGRVVERNRIRLKHLKIRRESGTL